jgi:hypothetical protein
MVLRRLDHPRVDILVNKLNPLGMGLQGLDLHMVMEMDPNEGKLRPVQVKLLAFHLPLNLGHHHSHIFTIQLYSNGLNWHTINIYCYCLGLH